MENELTEDVRDALYGLPFKATAVVANGVSISHQDGTELGLVAHTSQGWYFAYVAGEARISQSGTFGMRESLAGLVNAFVTDRITGRA